MIEFVVQRFLHMILVLAVVSVVSFIIIELPPGDYLTTLRLQLEEQQVSQEQIDGTLRLYQDRYALDQPWLVRYWRWISGILTGDLGYSMMMGNRVDVLLGDRLFLTMAISITTLIFTMVVAIPIGMLSAIRQYSMWDYLFTLVGFVGLATPNFLLALLFIFISVTVFDSTSVAGLFSPEYVFAPWSFAKVLDLYNHIWVVVVIVGTSGTAGMIRIVRTKMLDVLNEPYTDTARMKGLSNARIYFKHALRVAINPVVSSVGLSFPNIISGSAIVAVVLTLPTVGPLLLNALMAEDMYLAATILLLLTVALVIGNFLADLTLAWLDPRIRYGGQ